MLGDKFYDNYNAENKVKTCKPPRNPEEKKRCKTIIPRDNIPGSKDIVDCERH